MDMDVEAGKAENMMLTDVVSCVQEIISQTTPEILATKVFVTVSFRLKSITGYSAHRAWAIIPTSVASFATLFVGRESLNGTLVLAYEQHGVAKVVAYLVMTEQTSGSYLIDSVESGMVEMVLAPRQRLDLQHATYSSSGRIIKGKLEFDGSFPAVSYLF